MLIPSPRHRPADLEIWAALEDADCLRAERLARAGKIERSIEAIRAFAAAGPCYASVSWGKDSVVFASLVRRVAPGAPLVNLRVNPTRNPDCDAVRDAFLSRFPGPYHEEPVDYGEVDPALPSVVWDRETYRAWDAAWRGVGRAFGHRHLSGVRAEESFGRRTRMHVFGESSPNTCAPIGWWTLDEIFAYLAAESLPAHPAYAMLGGGRWDRKRLRVSEIGDEKGIGCGRRQWELEYYGDVLRRLQQRRPQTPAGPTAPPEG